MNGWKSSGTDTHTSLDYNWKITQINFHTWLLCKKKGNKSENEGKFI